MKNGITLVALVITIVVLLILAGLSINLVFGDNGIVKKAKEAGDKSIAFGVKERIGMVLLEYPMSTEYSSLEEFLNSQVAIEVDSVTKGDDGRFEVEKDGYVATVNSDCVIEKFEKIATRPIVKDIKIVENSNGKGDNLPGKNTPIDTPLYITFTHLIEGGTTTVSPAIPFKVTENGTYKFTVTGTVNGEKSTKVVSVTVNQYVSKYNIGDYVNYTYDVVSKGYTTDPTVTGYKNQTINQTQELKWRILNIDEEKGTVALISSTPTSDAVGFGGVLGYNNGPIIMNEICKEQYSNKSLGNNVKEVRNISLVDFERLMTDRGIARRNAFANNYGAIYGKTKTYTTNIQYPILYKNQKGAGVNITEENADKIEQPALTKDNLDPYEESKEVSKEER